MYLKKEETIHNTISLLQHRRADHCGQTTRVVAAEHAIVALFAPGRTPRVLDDPVRHGFVEQRILGHAVAHNQYTVVDLLLRAQRLPRMRHAAAVELHAVCVKTCAADICC